MNTSETAPQGPVGELSVLKTVGAAYGLFFRYLPSAAVAGTLPFVLLLAAVFAEHSGIVDLFGRLLGRGVDRDLLHGILILILGLAKIFAFSLFAVAWHRRILAGEKCGFFPRPCRRHLRFWGHATSLMLIAVGLVGLPLGILGYLAGRTPIAGSVLALLSTPLLLAVAYLWARLAFVLPATAMDETFSLSDSWRCTGNNGLRLMGAGLLAILPILVLVVLVATALAAFAGGPQIDMSFFFPRTIKLTSWFAQTLVTCLSLAILIALLSLAFRTCTGWVPASGGNRPVGPLEEDDAER